MEIIIFSIIILILFFSLVLFVKTKKIINVIVLAIIITGILSFPIYKINNYIFFKIYRQKINKQIEKINKIADDINYQISIYPKKFISSKYIINGVWITSKTPVINKQKEFLNKYGKGNVLFSKEKYISTLANIIQKQYLPLINSIYSNKYVTVEDKNKIKQIQFKIYKQN